MYIFLYLYILRWVSASFKGLMKKHVFLRSGIHSGNVTNSSGREELRWEGSLDESNLTSVTKHNGEQKYEHFVGPRSH